MSRLAIYYLFDEGEKVYNRLVYILHYSQQYYKVTGLLGDKRPFVLHATKEDAIEFAKELVKDHCRNTLKQLDCKIISNERNKSSNHEQENNNQLELI
jgi:hypothetical protein